MHSSDPDVHPLAKNLAVLIDADNMSASVIGALLAKVSTFGSPRIKRIYGDWTSPNLGSWKKVLLAHSIQPIQQFRNTVGKNATDSAMIIDAMDLLHSGRFDGFCLVSSDSDFTRLASRIREDGKLVLGFGREMTPRSFVSACDKFFYIKTQTGQAKKNISTVPKKDRAKAKAGNPAKKKAGAQTRQDANQLKGDTKLVLLLRAAVQASRDEQGWAHLGVVGWQLSQRSTQFTSKTYGYSKLSGLITATTLFDVKAHSGGIFVRDRRENPQPSPQQDRNKAGPQTPPAPQAEKQIKSEPAAEMRAPTSPGSGRNGEHFGLGGSPISETPPFPE